VWKPSGGERREKKKKKKEMKNGHRSFIVITRCLGRKLMLAKTI
jgi:hypothetical protein